LERIGDPQISPTRLNSVPGAHAGGTGRRELCFLIYSATVDKKVADAKALHPKDDY
jgi:hypothetical protein